MRDLVVLYIQVLPEIVSIFFLISVILEILVSSSQFYMLRRLYIYPGFTDITSFFMLAYKNLNDVRY